MCQPDYRVNLTSGCVGKSVPRRNRHRNWWTRKSCWSFPMRAGTCAEQTGRGRCSALCVCVRWDVIFPRPSRSVFSGFQPRREVCTVSPPALRLANCTAGSLISSCEPQTVHLWNAHLPKLCEPISYSKSQVCMCMDKYK